MTAYHFIQMKPTKTYLSIVDPQKKARFICFGDTKTADTFVNYVTHFRSKHGHWPNMDMSNRVATVMSKTGFKKRTPEELKKYLSLESFDYENIEEMAKRTNISFICVTNFAYLPDGHETQLVSFSGQEWDGEADERLYRELLEFNLKVK
uniref:Uncharacterized protein n=1 Tax=Ostreococcus mediterraneus virus 2 TaxID=2726183 RepID=A0A6H1QUK1_9PHYC|nr:hypothetical protein orf00043 [Ostreococcus mediterraneus virus 2]